MKIRIHILLILLIFSLLPFSSYGYSVVKKVDYESHHQKETVIIELKNEPTFKYFFLEKPYRFVIDFKDTRWDVVGIKEYNFPKQELTKIRYGIQNGYDLRLVFEAKKNFGNGDVTLERIEKPNGQTRYRLKVVLQDKEQLIKTNHYKPVIIIDAGHGGIDKGATGKNLHLHEKDITLKFARKLEANLQQSSRYKVILTRKKDEYLTLNQRIKFAGKHNGDLFISVHADSHNDPKLRGLSIYTLSDKASDKEAALLASKENKSDSFFGIDLDGHDENTRDLLIDLALRQQKNISSKFANIVINNISNQITLVRNTHRFAGFKVLKNVNVPSILVELGYLSNAEEERLLNNDTYQDKLVSSISRSIDKHFFP